ncbi:hypothetical protein N7539_008186 [Penicillium diatomitis]|uniref:Uncharacterized protein n=1 Tax=Penicillium diatomitis TaxID=2819901 RepID=A0A9X0BMY9_9EURO|nr:uncharacterized protein N7539_008186 [Penicillium diatomitis]KAJ5475120.1 hypothetical protein N7539_008186 [Penicillium diatomitis]
MLYEPGGTEHGFRLPHAPIQASSLPDKVSLETPSSTPKKPVRSSRTLATRDLRKVLIITAEQTPHGADEFELCGLTKEEATLVDGTHGHRGTGQVRVTVSWLPCVCGIRVIVDAVIGKVIGVHIAGSVLHDGIVDVRKT